MRPSTRLFQEFSHRITLFTRSNCSLCDDAKEALARVSSKRSFAFSEIDVMQSGQKRWKDLYEFDTPVVHIEGTSGTSGQSQNGHRITASTHKLMHRIKETDVEQLMDAISKGQCNA